MKNTEPEQPWWLDTNLKKSVQKKSIEKVQTSEVARQRYYAKLCTLQISENPFPNSDGAENNLLQTTSDEIELAKIYESHLTGYNDLAYPFDESKCDMTKGIGHKLHLNVAPENVAHVSQYLIQHRYHHKYLSGGEITDGKIFTIYIGSKDLTQKLAQQISNQLNDYLLKPIATEEIEYAPNVIGRFVGTQRDFMQYGLGLRGISVARNWADALSPWQSTDEKKKTIPLALKDSFDMLADQYGTFFYGSE